MSEKKPLPSISRRAPNARPDVRHDEDPENAKTIQDFFPTGDLDERVSDSAKSPRAPVDGADDGFVMDFDTSTPAPVKRR